MPPPEEKVRPTQALVFEMRKTQDPLRGGRPAEVQIQNSDFSGLFFPRPDSHPTAGWIATYDNITSAKRHVQPRNLGCYGDFLEHIPRRLGENDALDASVKVLVSAFPYHYTGRLPPDALVNYIHALKTLRLSLGRENKNLAPETLSAIYIIMICQGWIGRSDDHVKSHGEILARLTSSAIVQNWRDAFEIRLLETLFVPLVGCVLFVISHSPAYLQQVLEAMVNPAISMDSWYMLIDSCLPLKLPDKQQGIRVPSLEAQKLVRMPAFFHNPLLHLADIELAYRELCTDQPRIRQYLAGLDREIADRTLSDPTRANRTKLSHKFQVVYSVLLTIAIALNSLRRTLNPNDTALLEEAAVLTDDFILLARHASRYRPLGASYIPPCLAAVWATTDALTEQQAELERLMAEYQPDFPQIKWMEQAVWLKSSHNVLLGQLTSSASSEASWDGHEVLNMSMVHCKAAFGPGGSYLFL
ncbi:hypothetical protein ACJZ2D_005945 [Fusarium nematophilum]